MNNYRSVVEAVKKHAELQPEKTAVICDDVSMSYGVLWKKTLGFANYLNTLQMEKGSRIIVKGIPVTETIIAYLGIHLAGYVNVPVEKTIGIDGLYEIASEVSASAIISDIDVSERYLSVLTGDINSIADSAFCENAEIVLPELGDLADILFTTGTTGKSKGVMISHRALIASSENLICGSEIPEDNVYLIPVPINHANGIRKVYATLVSGTTLVLLDGLADIRKFYNTVEKYKVTYLLLPPSAVRMLLTLSGKKLAKYADQIKAVHTSAAPFPEADKERMKEILPNTKLIFAYGLSEASNVSMFDYAKNPVKICCVGRPNIHSRVIIVDDDRNEIRSSAENQGLIAIGGDALMEGYYNAPEMTAEVLQNGFIYTNDLGYFDEDGMLYVLGRRGDVINMGGLKIAPTEVENVALRFPGIAECACYGVEDKMNRMIPQMIYVPERGKEINIEELAEFMSTKLEAYKVPKKFTEVKEIPKTSNGKINRKLLK